MATSGCTQKIDAVALYTSQCASCHASDGSGDPRRVRTDPALDLTRSPLVLKGLDGRIYRLIDGGVGGMPAFGHKMDYQQMQALARYVLTFAPAETESDAQGESP
jgi:mono/diheme cytochrome c family protein